MDMTSESTLSVIGGAVQTGIDRGQEVWAMLHPPPGYYFEPNTNTLRPIVGAFPQGTSGLLLLLAAVAMLLILKR